MDNPSIISHVSVGTNQFEKAAHFYDRVLGTLGVKRIMEHPGAIAYGKMFPEFWLQSPLDGQKATIANGVHFGFVASSKEQVERFFQTAMELGAKGDGDPGARPQYSDKYYGCFVRDLDGHKIEATFWDE